MKEINLHGYEAVVNCYDDQCLFMDILVYCDEKDIEKVIEAFDNGLDDFFEDDTCTICWGDAVVYHLDGIDCYVDYATLTDDGMDVDNEWRNLIAETVVAAKHFRGHCYGI